MRPIDVRHGDEVHEHEIEPGFENLQHHQQDPWRKVPASSEKHHIRRCIYYAIMKIKWALCCEKHILLAAKCIFSNAQGESVHLLSNFLEVSCHQDDLRHFDYKKGSNLLIDPQFALTL